MNERRKSEGEKQPGNITPASLQPFPPASSAPFFSPDFGVSPADFSLPPSSASNPPTHSLLSAQCHVLRDTFGSRPPQRHALSDMFSREVRS